MKLYISIFILFFSIQIYSQESIAEAWVELPAFIDHTISINTSGLEKFTDKIFFVWTLFDYKKPLSIEEVSDDIKKAKYYYIFNNESEKYSILQVIYYDSKGNVVKSFSYDRDTENQKYKFNFPVYDSGDERTIYNFCTEYITKSNTK
ncbi:MAG: surface-adhesin E family protein [Melioribacteraceae bacterium]